MASSSSTDDGGGSDYHVSRVRVSMLGGFLLLLGTLGFYVLPGMIQKDAPGSKLVNAFYCSAITLTT